MVVAVAVNEYGFRAIILSVTIAALFTMWMEKSEPPVKIVPYCKVYERIAKKHPRTGEWMFGWGEHYGLCDRQDKYFEI